jgi:aspartyl-tRNA(Asn)/glutamyl-tRNA(Gln) amidotransferase subunit C
MHRVWEESRDDKLTSRTIRCKRLFLKGLRSGLLPRISASTAPHPVAMALDLAQIRRVADLARIEVSDAEAQRVLAQLNDIFRMIERMQALDTEGVEPMAHPLGGVQRLRDDVVTVGDERNANLANAPEQQDGLFLVPRVIE